MLELLIIKSLLVQHYYSKYRSYIRLKKEDKELLSLYSVLDEMVDIHHRDLTLDEYKLSVCTKFPELQELLVQIEKADIAPEVMQESVQLLVERSMAYDLARIAIDVSEGRKELSSVLDFYEKLKDKEKVEEVSFVTDDLEELYETTVHTPGLRWRLPTLNRMLGSLRKGDFGFVFARPETGKTTFLASEVTFFAEQLKEEEGPILWFNNEEQGSKVKVRCYQASLGCDLTKLYSLRKEANEAFLKRTHGNIKILDNASIHKRRVESLCKELKPSLIIFDQIDKLKGFDNDREDLRLGGIYIWARELAKTFCPVIGVCQADVSGENKKWLGMDNVANAKTAKQAEADWILGIGKVHDIGLENIRYLHLSKNKLSGDPDSDQAMRHGRQEVIIKAEIARYADFGT